MTSHPDNFQNWTTVILRKNSKESAKNNAITEVQQRKSGDAAPRDIEKAQPLITPELKQKIITIRTTILKMNQEQLANSICEPIKNIRLCENGKLTLKESKQIAIKVERKFGKQHNFKILERT
tara:strand:+ start:727 stop:1095 length:369 start_codon:yes stop_codon:yes gene_type:complete